MKYLEENKIIIISLANYDLKIKYVVFILRTLFANRNENIK